MAVADSTPVALPILRSDKATLVDAADAEYLATRKLYLTDDGYAFFNNARRWSVSRWIMQPPPGMVVDHISGDTLDNRRANLRVCTHAQNLANGRSHSDSRSRYRGVSWKAREGSWRAQISIGKQRSRFLGQWPTEEDAALAYDQAAREQYGEYARLNFPGALPSASHQYQSRSERAGLGLPRRRVGSGPGGIRTHATTIMSGLSGPDDRAPHYGTSGQEAPPAPDDPINIPTPNDC